MKSVCEDVVNAAKNDMNIMITGETGTGKTFLSKILHQLSKRSDKKFEAIHCGLISNDVNSFKSHLFGHVKGAYTGAVGTRTGVFEIVEDGTLVIDDITTMPIEVQSGLLEVLDNRCFYKMGDSKVKIPFNARVILTSNQNLNTSIEENLLRKDFKFRITQEFITIPPLRNRIEDIPYLVKQYMEIIADASIRGKEISEESMALLQRQPWLGNTRQLFHLISRAAYHENASEISLNTIKKELMKDYEINEIDELELMNKLNDADLETQLDKLRKDYIIKSLAKSKGNISETARNLGYQNHNGLQYWLKKYNIDVKEFKE
jgi:DNA-binding NtrC family response regulator